MKRTIWLAALALAGCGGKAKAPSTPIASFDVQHYDYAIDLATSRVTSTLSIQAGAAGNCVALPYRPAAIESATLDGKHARASVKNGVLTACGATRASGDTFELAVTFELAKSHLASSQVGYTVTTDIAGQPFTYLLSWVNECDRLGPCDNRPPKFATYHFTVEHSASTQVLCPGAISATATETVCDFPYAGGPDYSSFGVMASPSWTKTDLGTWGTTAVSLYDMPGTNIAANFPTADVQAYHDWLVSTFGAYPYGTELRYAVGPTYWAGFEHPGNILLADSLVSGGSYYANALQHVAMHELTHQWAGDQTTLAGTYDFVWKESMAEYLTYVWEDEHEPAGVAAATASAWKTWAHDALYFPVPTDSPALFAYYGDAYGPGPMVLFHQLEGIYGRPAVITALQSLLGHEHAISIDDVQAALEASTGADLTTYFDGWVKGSGVPAWPEATVTVTDMGGGSYQVGAALATADGVTRACDFSVRLSGSAGQTYDVPLQFGVSSVSSAPQTVTPGFTVTSHSVDPDAKCLVWEAPGTGILSAWPRTRVEPWRTR
jgi:aminopeptidase N